MFRALRLVCLSLAFAPSAPASAREAIGVFGGWAAFRDAPSGRCYAIAEPARRPRGGGRAYLTVMRRPAGGVRGQVYLRLSRARTAGEALTLSIGDKSIGLVGAGFNAWAKNARADRSIVAAMRMGSSLSVEGIGIDGHPFADVYRLHGAASAIDAAAVRCLTP